MKMMDCVEVTVEKEIYARDGVHRGMQGWICFEQCAENYWLVNFPQCGEKDDIATISIQEADLKEIPIMHAIVNEQIKAQFERSGLKALFSMDDEVSDYLI